MSGEKPNHLDVALHQLKTTAVYNLSKKQETDMRIAALTLGVGRVAEAIETLGVWP